MVPASLVVLEVRETAAYVLCAPWVVRKQGTLGLTQQLHGFEYPHCWVLTVRPHNWGDCTIDYPVE